jgi:hypothetical protein
VPDVARRDKDSKRVEGRNSPFQGPSRAGRWVTRYTWDAVRRTGIKMTGSNGQERNKGNGRGRVESLKEHIVSSGQVSTGNAVTDASYVP